MTDKSSVFKNSRYEESVKFVSNASRFATFASGDLHNWLILNCISFYKDYSHLSLVYSSVG